MLKVIYALFFLCNKEYCLTTDKIASSFSSNSFFSQEVEVFTTSLPALSEVLDDRASLAVLGWMSFHTLLERVLPGEVAFGTQLSTGDSLSYSLSGHLQFWVTLLVLFCGSVDITYNAEGNFTLGSRLSAIGSCMWSRTIVLCVVLCCVDGKARQGKPGVQLCCSFSNVLPVHFFLVSPMPPVPLRIALP